MQDTLLNTPLTEHFESIGARLVPFAGFMMPVQFSGLKAEHAAVRTAAGLFDVSHMGELHFQGAAAFDFLQHLLAGDVAKACPGRCLYTVLLNDEGGVIDDLLVYGLTQDRFMLVVNASNRMEVVSVIGERLASWSLGNGRADEVSLVDRSDTTGLIALQGPASDAIVAQVIPGAELLEFYGNREFDHPVFGALIVSATGYTGERGFEIYSSVEQTVSIWNSLMEAGEPFGLIAAGLGARDTLRLEKGYCLHGQDIGPSCTPIEAGLNWTVGWKTEFVGKAALVRQKEAGVQVKRVGIKLLGRGIPRTGHEVVDSAGEVVGEVTSGTQSPTLNAPIGLAYVNVAHAQVGTQFAVRIRNNDVAAEVVKVPFC